MSQLLRRCAIGVLVLWLACALGGRLLPLQADTIDLTQVFAPPSAADWLGRDELGRSLAARIVSGAGVSCGVGLAVTLIALVLGVAVGLTAALAGGRVDLLLARLIDVFMAFPGILLAIALAGVLGPGLDNVVWALAAVSWVGFARLTRAQTLALKNRDHVLAARALGSRRRVLIGRHILPLIVAPLVVEASFVLAGSVVAEAGLSFLGLGVQAPAASWGNMIRQAMQFLLVAPHMLPGPCLALMSLVVCANVLGDSLRTRWQLQGSEEGKR